MATARELLAQYVKIFADNDSDPRLGQIEEKLARFNLQIQMAGEPKFLKETEAYDVVAIHFQLLDYKGDVVDNYKFAVRIPHNGGHIIADAPLSRSPVSTLVPVNFELDAQDLAWLGALGLRW